MNDIAWNLLTTRPETGSVEVGGRRSGRDNADNTDNTDNNDSADNTDNTDSADSVDTPEADADGDHGGGDGGGDGGRRRGAAAGAGGPPGSRRWPGRRRTIAACAVVGACFDVAVRADGLGVMAAVTAAAAVLVARTNSTRRPSRARNVIAAFGLAFAASLAVRSAAWVRALDLLGVVVCLVLVSDVALRARSLLASSVVRAFVRPLRGIGATLAMIEQAMSTTGRRVMQRTGARGGSARLAGVARGGALAAPVVAVLAMLLVSADRVFASMFRLPTFPDLSPVGSHVAVAAFGGCAVLFVAAGGLFREPAPLSVPRALVGRTEAVVVLGAVDALFAAFALVQLLAVVRGAAYVQQTSGLTYAEYARSGFFQLLAVACLTLMTIGGVRRLAGIGAYERQVRRFGVTTCVLTLVVTAVAFRRLWLYEDAYGITPARVVAHAGTITVGLVIMTVLWGIVRSRPDRDLRGLVTSTSLVIGALMIVLLNVINPSGWAARSAISRLTTGSAEKLTTVDADGLPTLAARLRTADLVGLAPDERAVLASRWCPTRATTNWPAANLGAARARTARTTLCALVSTTDPSPAAAGTGPDVRR